jgi:hypothetical protein
MGALPIIFLVGGMLAETAILCNPTSDPSVIAVDVH